MKKYLKQFGFVALLLVMIVGVSGCSQKNESKENGGQKVSQSQDNESAIEKENSKKDSSETKKENSEKNEDRGECWKKFVNAEYNFTVKYVVSCNSLGESELHEGAIIVDANDERRPMAVADAFKDYHVVRGKDKKKYMEELTLLKEKENMFKRQDRNVHVYTYNGMLEPVVIEIELDKITSIFIETDQLDGQSPIENDEVWYILSTVSFE